MVDRSRNIMFFALSTLLMLGAGAYICIRLVAALEMPLWLRVLLILFIFFSSQSISFMRFMVTAAPGIPFGWLRVGGYVSALFMTLFSFVVIRDMALLFLWLVDLLLHSELFAAAIGLINSPGVDAALLGGSALFAAFGMWSALRVPRIREWEVDIPDLPAELDGLRIAHLSDLHIGSTFDRVWLERVVESTNAMDPDLVLITGDLVDGTPSVLKDDLLPLAALRAKLGVLISVGNHEYYSGMMSWVNTWRDMGLTVLLNEHRVFEISGRPLVVAGVADPNAQRFPGLVPPDPEGARAGAPRAFTILMAHQPKEARSHAALGYHLQLSGHTHGGQYFFLFPLAALMNRGFLSGLYDVDGMKLYVTPGAGMWGYVPMRLGAPSEITVLTLKTGYR